MSKNTCFEGPEIGEAPHFLAFATGRLGGSIVCLLLTSRTAWFLWDVWGSYLPSRKDVRHGSQKKTVFDMLDGYERV